MSKFPLFLEPRHPIPPTYKSADRFLLAMLAFWVAVCAVAIVWFVTS